MKRTRLATFDRESPHTPDSPYKPIHLRPLSHAGQRVWLIGQVPQRETEHVIHVCKGHTGHQTFGFIRTLFRQLDDTARSAGLKRAASRLDAAAHQGEQASEALLNDSVAFAALRRISRESVYTSQAIDQSARALVAYLQNLGKDLHVHSMSDADRPSLKVLARTMLLLGPSENRLVWDFDADPTIASDSTAASVARANLFSYLDFILKPTIRRGVSNGVTLKQPLKWTSRDVAVALVLQNYEAVFWATEGCRDAESLRLRTIAHVNVGDYAAALADLDRALCVASNAFRPQLFYLQGLVLAKRRYDRNASDASFTAGLNFIDEVSWQDDECDRALEQAWLYNGLALNASLAWNRDRHREELVRAFRLEQQAFALVSTGSSAARAYLRFNLIANTAFLLEMQGEYELAAQAFDQIFTFDSPGSEENRHRLIATLGYRIGVLRLKAGNLQAARALLEAAYQSSIAIGEVSSTERLLRAKGLVERRLGDYSRALASYQVGLELSREARFYQGAVEHLRGLYELSQATGNEHLAAETLASGIAEGIESTEICQEPSSPSPKLPSYIPEIDLEGMPQLDLNRVLGGES